MNLGRLVMVGAAGAMVAMMSGCGATVPAGTAAVVDGHRITSHEVTAATREFNEVSAGLAAQNGKIAQGMPESVIASVLARSEAALAVAGPDRGSVLATAEAMTAHDETLVPFQSKPNAKKLFVALSVTQVMSQKLGEQQFEAALQGVPAEFNPRFGLQGLQEVQADPTTGGPLLSSGSLSKRSMN